MGLSHGCIMRPLWRGVHPVYKSLQFPTPAPTIPILMMSVPTISWLTVHTFIVDMSIIRALMMSSLGEAGTGPIRIQGRVGETFSYFLLQGGDLTFCRHLRVMYVHHSLVLHVHHRVGTPPPPLGPATPQGMTEGLTTRLKGVCWLHHPLGAPSTEARMAGWEVKTMNSGHEALIDLILANPTATHGELGAHLGRSKEWVQLVTQSDLFKEAYHVRAAEMRDPLLAATLEQNLQFLTNISVAKLMEKMARPAADIPDSLALQAAQFGAKALAVGGFSSKPPAPPPAPMTGRIERLAERLLNLGRAQGPVQDVPFVEMETGS